jgi:hypothetical protein
MSEQGYMKCKSDPPLDPCNICGAEINANWTIRALQKEKAKLEKALNQVDHQIVHLMDGNPDMVDYDVIAESEHRLYGENG